MTMFRSILGGLLWLTATRLDLISDVCLLQSKVTAAKICHLRQANNVIKRAQNEIGHGIGLYYKRPRAPLRLVCVHDSSAAGNIRNYAQEGILILLTEDRIAHFSRDSEHELSEDQAFLMGGRAHVLYAHGAKAKRISYSTSHAETLAAISGLEAGSLLVVRLAELLHVPMKPTIQSLTAAQEFGMSNLPLDFYGDCKGLYELCSGGKALCQDKSQRLYILALKEARVNNRMRWMALVPTQSMTSDALTKSMSSPPLMLLLSTGTVAFKNESGHPICMRILPTMRPASEADLLKADSDLVKEVSTGVATMGLMANHGRTFSYALFLMLMMIPSATAATTSTTRTSSTPSMSSSGFSPWR